MSDLSLAPLLSTHTLTPVMQASDSPDKQPPCWATDLTTHLVCTAGTTPMAAHPGVRSASGGPCCSRSTTKTPRRLRRLWVSRLPCTHLKTCSSNSSTSESIHMSLNLCNHAYIVSLKDSMLDSHCMGHIQLGMIFAADVSQCMEILRRSS